MAVFTALVRRPFALGILALLVSLFVDQLTKQMAQALENGGAIEVTEFFFLVFIRNPGSSFGVLADAGDTGRWLFIIGAVAVSIVLVIWMACTQRLWLCLSFGMMTGGALGNALDRLRYGAVTDFLDFHIGDWVLPTFNFADLAIWLGIIVLYVDTALEWREKRAARTPPPMGM